MLDQQMRTYPDGSERSRLLAEIEAVVASQQRLGLLETIEVRGCNNLGSLVCDRAQMELGRFQQEAKRVKDGVFDLVAEMRKMRKTMEVMRGQV